MAQVDPFIIPLPRKLAADPEVGPYFAYLSKFLHDLWKRTGAGDDLVGVAVNAADVASAIAVHTGSNDNTTQTELDAAVSAHVAAADPHPVYKTAAEVAADFVAHEGAVNPHPTYLTAAEGDAAYEPIGEVAAAVPDVADDYANDAAAATGGIGVGELYHTSGTVKLRLS